MVNGFDKRWGNYHHGLMRNEAVWARMVLVKMECYGLNCVFPKAYMLMS